MCGRATCSCPVLAHFIAQPPHTAPLQIEFHVAESTLHHPLAVLVCAVQAKAKQKEKEKERNGEKQSRT